MNAFSENLLTALERTDGEDAIFGVLVDAAHQLGFEHCAYGLRLAFPVSNPQVIVRSNYPIEWQTRYRQAGYIHIDPSVLHGRRTTQPLVWNDAVFASAKKLWAEANEHGLCVGWAQSSLDGFGVGGMLTLSRSSDALTAAELLANEARMRWLVQAAHISLSRLMKPRLLPQLEAPLTAREVEVLKWSADGKTAAEIGDILSISLPTVTFHMKNAVAKLKVANKTAAVVQALLSGHLN